MDGRRCIGDWRSSKLRGLPEVFQAAGPIGVAVFSSVAGGTDSCGMFGSGVEVTELWAGESSAPVTSTQAALSQLTVSPAFARRDPTKLVLRRARRQFADGGDYDGPMVMAVLRVALGEHTDNRKNTKLIILSHTPSADLTVSKNGAANLEWMFVSSRHGSALTRKRNLTVISKWDDCWDVRLSFG